MLLHSSFKYTLKPRCMKHLIVKTEMQESISVTVKCWNNIICNTALLIRLFFSVVKHIHKIQVLYNSKHALKHALPHIATRCEVLAKEVLGFVCILLLNANQEVQVHVDACQTAASWKIFIGINYFSMAVVCLFKKF